MRGRGIPRPVEATLAGIGLVACSPLLALCGAVVRLTSLGPVLYRQQRVGLAGRHFTLLKFRTMSHGSRGPAITAGSDPRITKIGRLLRRVKLDELPQLWNVLRGDMALVGPRPEVPEFVDLSDKRWQTVLAARPGLMDPMTLRLWNEESLLAKCGDDPVCFYVDVLLGLKLEGYLEYLRRRTWWTDVKVLVATLQSIVSTGGAAEITVEQIRSRAPSQKFDIKGTSKEEG